MNHYDVLEVSHKASAEVIRAAYKSLMQRYHPDKNAGLVDKARDAARITQAYEVLSDAGKRAAYDLELAGAVAGASSATEFGERRPSMTAASSAYGKPGPARERRSWLPWVVIASILVAGSIILLQSRKAPKLAAPASDAQATSAAAPSVAERPVTGAPAQSAVAVAATESAADLQARTVPSFATALRIELVPADRNAGAPLHVLQIPELGFRVDARDAVRWAKKIEALRAPLLEKLLARLALADYDQLMGVNADIYLKRIIGNAVLDGIAYEDTSPRPAPPIPALPSSPDAITLPPPPPVAVLLPQSFSVR